MKRTRMTRADSNSPSSTNDTSLDTTWGIFENEALLDRDTEILQNGYGSDSATSFDGILEE